MVLALLVAPFSLSHLLSPRLVRLLRLRNEVQKLVTGQAARLSEPSKSKAYLKNQYEQLLQSLMVSRRAVRLQKATDVC